MTWKTVDAEEIKTLPDKQTNRITNKISNKTYRSSECKN